MADDTPVSMVTSKWLDSGAGSDKSNTEIKIWGPDFNIFFSQQCSTYTGINTI